MNILIGITAHDEKAYCLEKSLMAVACLKHRCRSARVDILVTVGREDIASMGLFKLVFGRVRKRPLPTLVTVERQPVAVPADHVFLESRAEAIYIENITAARNAIREVALEGGYDYLLFMDADVVVEAGALDIMLTHRGTSVLIVPLPLRTFDKRGVFTGAALSNIHLGATMIRRPTLQRIPFRCEVDGGRIVRGEDKCFFHDLFFRPDVTRYGESVKVCTGISALHYIDPNIYPLGYSNQDLRPR